MPKIVLSSVHGSAAGAGMGLAFVTDLCIAADDARFTPAYAKIGVSPDGGSTVGMVGTVGTRRALQIFLAEDSFTAQQAYQWGLVARVVPAAELKAETRKFAERLAQNPPAAIAGTKSLVYQAAVTPTRQQLDAEEKRDHRRHAHRRFPRRGEEVHQQVEMKLFATPSRSFLCLRHGATDWNAGRADFRAAPIIPSTMMASRRRMRPPCGCGTCALDHVVASPLRSCAADRRDHRGSLVDAAHHRRWPHRVRFRQSGGTVDHRVDEERGLTAREQLVTILPSDSEPWPASPHARSAASANGSTVIRKRMSCSSATTP